MNSKFWDICMSKLIGHYIIWYTLHLGHYIIDMRFDIRMSFDINPTLYIIEFSCQEYTAIFFLALKETWSHCQYLFSSNYT